MDQGEGAQRRRAALTGCQNLPAQPKSGQNDHEPGDVPPPPQQTAAQQGNRQQESVAPGRGPGVEDEFIRIAGHHKMAFHDDRIPQFQQGQGEDHPQEQGKNLRPARRGRRKDSGGFAGAGGLHAGGAPSGAAKSNPDFTQRGS